MSAADEELAYVELKFWPSPELIPQAAADVLHRRGQGALQQASA